SGEQLGQRTPFHRRLRMQREVHPLDLHVVFHLQLLNTHGTEIAPGSGVVGEDLHRDGFCHAASLTVSLNLRKTSRCPSGNLSPAFRGSAMSDVAPRVFHASTCFIHPSALWPARWIRPSSGSLAG